MYYYLAYGLGEFEKGLIDLLAGSVSDQLLEKDDSKLKERLSLREDGKGVVGREDFHHTTEV